MEAERLLGAVCACDAGANTDTVKGSEGRSREREMPAWRVAARHEGRDFFGDVLVTPAKGVQLKLLVTRESKKMAQGRVKEAEEPPPRPRGRS